MEPNLALYREMARIRKFEETVLDQFSRGAFSGTTHTYLGQEANAVGVLSHLTSQDLVFSNHRCHGHFLAYGGDMRGLFAELMGRATGVCGGRSGSQHIHWQGFYANGVLGSTVPLATGAALAEKLLRSGRLAVVFLGDGALGEGVVYEALNMAALWGAPILYVLENNHIAQTTPLEQHLAGDMQARFTAFGLPALSLDSSDVLEIQGAAGELISSVRRGSPQALILHTRRFGPHSKGDDTRPPQEVDRLRASRDPLAIHGQRLAPGPRQEVDTAVEQEVQEAFGRASRDPYPEAKPLPQDPE